MVNYYDKHLFISKKKLAELAGVSRYTFSRYLKSRRHILETMGVSLHARLLPPQAVKYICEDYCRAAESAGLAEFTHLPESDPRTPDDHLL